MDHINHVLKDTLGRYGFECHPFKIAWYNAMVSEHFRFDLPGDTLAYIVISTPEMFEEAFVPYVCREECTGKKDPIDECISSHLKDVRQQLDDQEIEVIHDYELHPNRRPKVLVQTAGHVAGACYFYQRKDVVNQPWKEKQKIFGVSIHPMYGGWFALRGVLIFKNLQVPELVQKPPPDVLPDDQRKIEVLERFNFNWQDWSFRDVVEPIARYSDQQKLYFATAPKDRLSLLDTIRRGEQRV